jgi:hypothetical protein
MSDTTASAPAAPNQLLIWGNWFLDLLKIPAIGQTMIVFAGALAAAFTFNYATAKPPKPIPAADMPSFVTPAELAKAHADISAKLEANRKTMAEIKELIASIPSAPAAKKAPLK